ncbi:MAG: SRPBCC family protein [Longimicrobiales bacterium]
MKKLLFGVSVLIALIGLIFVIGALLPQSHVASVTRHYNIGPEHVWRAITEVEHFAAWRPGLASAQRLPAQEGRERWQEKTKYDAMTIEVTESLPTQRLVTRIADEGLPFGGTWTYELRSTAGGTELVITERGEVYSPLFRFISRFVTGYEGTMEKYHQGLEQRLSADRG